MKRQELKPGDTILVPRLTLRVQLLLAVTASVALSSLSITGAAAQSAKTMKQEIESSRQADERIHKIEEDSVLIPQGANEPPLKLNLRQFMELANVSQLSVAVIENYKIDWAKGYGVTDSGAPVTPHTLFQAASISKPVSTLAALRLVEQGKLSLDEDVNLKLKSWKVPENEYTKNQKVTLRRIFTHTAGTTIHGFLGYKPGQPLPTLVQMLDGEEPANSKPVRVDFVPGTKQRYSGGGFLVLQQLMIDVTGKPYPQIMRDLVLDPLGLPDSTYEQPLPSARVAAAASGRDRNGEPLTQKWNVLPEMALGGLWTTPSDLGRIGIEVALSDHGKSNRVLSESMTREMLRLQVDPNIESPDGYTMRMGLGWFLGDESDPGRFEHGGVNVGFISEFVMWDSGHGVAVMLNNWSNLGQSVARSLIGNIAKEYGWNYVRPKPAANDVLVIVAKVKGPEAAIRAYGDLKKNHSSEYAFGDLDLNQFGYELLGANKIDEALQAFKLNVEQYPANWNAYDSLGEAYMKAGQTSLAIQNYEKSLELNPKNQDGAEMLKKLKGQN